MQKLITIYLDNKDYLQRQFLSVKFTKQHGFIEEHLADYLSDGWRITSVNAFGGHSNYVDVRGWVIVVLEKDEPAAGSPSPGR